MSSSPEARAWSPTLDLTPTGLSQFDPARVQEAIDRGFQAGYRAGEAAAAHAQQVAHETELLQLQLRVADLLGALQRAVDGADARAAALADDFATLVTDTAVRLADAVIGRELSDPCIAARDALARALGSLDHTEKVVVHLHPDDVALVGDAVPADVQLVPDDHLAPGDAVAVAGDRTVDARIATALERARAVLEGRA